MSYVTCLFIYLFILRAVPCCAQLAVWWFGVNADWKPERCSYFAFEFAQGGKMPRQWPRPKVPARLLIIKAAMFISTNEGIKYLLAVGAAGEKKKPDCFALWNMKVWPWRVYESPDNWENTHCAPCDMDFERMTFPFLQQPAPRQRRKCRLMWQKWGGLVQPQLVMFSVGGLK